MTTTPASAVHARGLTRRFGDFTAVDGLDLDVPAGEIFGFLGANGAGKTTAIRMLCGLLAPSGGEAVVAGVQVGGQAGGRFGGRFGGQARELKRRIGYMSQRFSLYDDLTVAENLEFFGGIYGLFDADLAERRHELLPQLGLADLERRLAGSLPLGFKQRLALGCALLHRPRVVFLDEPTGGVDPVARRRFWDLIYEQAAGGVTVFVTTHYMDEAEYCGRVSIMVQGKLVALDTPSGLKASTGGRDMQDVFLRLVDA
ncbi:MAG: ABC transporter ATP-binding protein [bacterium]|jgi:ABC-2 type transport system ATP-binding protein|nr:ABC transporter ATP-binding protein [bacterium]MBK9776849.1 ABC transporter ATP-binding protein [bacterium]